MFFQATMPMPQNLQDWESSPSDKFNKLHESVYFDNTTGMTMFFSNLDMPMKTVSGFLLNVYLISVV